jgi:hypothetical protein
MMHKKNPSSESYDVGYGRPPKKFRFRRGQSGNPSGKRRKASAPDLKAQLQSALNRTVTIGSGKHQKVISKGAAGIEQLVDQFAAGDRNARRDLVALCKEFGVDVTNRESLVGAIEDVLTAQDEAILADYVERHGGHYSRRDESVSLLPRQKSNGLTLPLNGSNSADLPRERLDE